MMIQACAGVVSSGLDQAMNRRRRAVVNDTFQPFWHNFRSWKGSAAACRR